MEDHPPQGTVVFTTVGRYDYGFDVFSVPVLSGDKANTANPPPEETRHTDGVSVNFNGQFLDDVTVSFVSERYGYTQPFLTTAGSKGRAAPLPHFPESLFHDRPVVRNGVVYFASAHERPQEGPFRSWSAIYSARLDEPEAAPKRLTPPGTADFSPAVSHSGELVAVATHGEGPWKGDFRELQTEVVVFRASDPARRVAVSGGRGGWPAWSGDSTVFFHRVAEDGWWSVFRVDLDAPDLAAVGPPRRVTPPGLHAFTPTAARDGTHIAVATRRREREFRHIELLDLETGELHAVTEAVNPNLHHYNPFLSPSGKLLGYHRFRGESAPGDSIIPHLEPMASRARGLQMVRVHGSFPSFSPRRNLIVINGDDFQTGAGLMVLKSDGSRRWKLLEQPAAFYTSWSPTERGVVYTSLGSIFQGPRATVQVVRVVFDPEALDGLADDALVPSKVKVLTRADAGNNAFPSCSPDGKWVVFRSGRSGRKNLYIVDAARGEAEGGGIRQLTDGDWIDTMPSWSPDGELIAFSSNRHDPSDPEVFGLYLVRPDGTGLRRVHVAGPEGSAEAGRERINHVCFSPDSKWLLFTANIGAVSADPVGLPNQFQPYGDLFACRVEDGGGLRRLTCNCYENGTPAWVEVDLVAGIGPLCPGGAAAGVKLRGQFVEPLWLNFDV